MKKKDLPNSVVLGLVIIWLLVIFVHYLYGSTIVGEAVSDVNSGTATVSFNVVIREDTTPPTIISTTISPYDAVIGEDVFLDISATDNKAIGRKSANLTLPNGSVIFLSLPANYTVQNGGKHEVTFFVSDTSNNTRTREDYFIAGTLPINVTFNAVDSKLKGLPANLTIFLPGTDKKVAEYEFTGVQQWKLTDIFYDLYYSAFEGNINLRLNSINFSLNQNKTLGLDYATNLTEPDRLVIYGIDNTYSFATAALMVSYANTNYVNEDYLGFYKCADWNFTAQTCLGEWETYAGTQDKITNTFTFTTNSFSAFSIKQESIPLQQVPSGGGGLGKAASIPKGFPEIIEKIPEEEEKIKVPEEKPLFDISINVLNEYKKVFPGEDVIVEIALTKTAGPKADVNVLYSLLDPDGRIIDTKQEIVAVETKTAFVTKLTVSEDAKPGDYNFKIKITINEETWEGSDSFEVIERPLEEIIPLEGIHVSTSIVLGVLLVIFLVFALIFYYMYKQTQNLIKLIPKITEEDLIKEKLIKMR